MVSIALFDLWLVDADFRSHVSYFHARNQITQNAGHIERPETLGYYLRNQPKNYIYL